MTKKILFVVTSATHFSSKELPTGLWMEELASPYYVFSKAGFEISFATPAGGPIPIDANSLRDPFFTEEAKKFLHDADAMDKFNHTKKLGDIVSSLASDYDVMYMPGGHGCCSDFVSNPTLKTAIESAYASGMIVASVCHGPIALAECVKPDGSPLVKGLKVTGFSDSEEAAVGHTDNVPYLIETRFKEQGAQYEKADQDWSGHIVVDGNLLTGQNPGSSTLAAEKVVEMLS